MWDMPTSLHTRRRGGAASATGPPGYLTSPATTLMVMATTKVPKT